jgi:hypothetical protein
MGKLVARRTKRIVVISSSNTSNNHESLGADYE